jgi:predicted nucleotidyltransferase
MSALSSIKEVLHKMKPELASKYNVSSIGLFGSVVRDDFTPTSDIDIIVDFSEPIGIAFIDLAELIEKRLNKTVDLVSKNGVKKKYFSEIEAEIIYV